MEGLAGMEEHRNSPGPANEPRYRRTISADSPRHNGSGPLDVSPYPGRLIVLEGTDGVGRSTQIALLREWLETQGFGVLHTGLTRSRLAGDGLRKAKMGTTLSQRTLDLFYATDFADRLETDIVPALRSGFVVLTDRYVFSSMARSMVRGLDREWLRDLYRFAPVPHGVLYLKIDVAQLVSRVLARGAFDYWESGMDFLEEPDVYRSFVRYQTKLLEVFNELALTYGFQVVDASRGIADVFHDLKQETHRLVSGMRGAPA